MSPALISNMSKSVTYPCYVGMLSVLRSGYAVLQPDCRQGKRFRSSQAILWRTPNCATTLEIWHRWPRTQPLGMGPGPGASLSALVPAG